MIDQTLKTMVFIIGVSKQGGVNQICLRKQKKD